MTSKVLCAINKNKNRQEELFASRQKNTAILNVWLQTTKTESTASTVR